jgi:hypothetical protein
MENNRSKFNNSFLANTFIVAGFVAVVCGFAYMYLSIPIVGQNPDGKCEWIITDGIEKRACPSVLPEKYSIEYVSFKSSENGKQ